MTQVLELLEVGSVGCKVMKCCYFCISEVFGSCSFNKLFIFIARDAVYIQKFIEGLGIIHPQCVY